MSTATIGVCTCWRLVGEHRDTHQPGCHYAGMTVREVVELSLAPVRMDASK